MIAYRFWCAIDWAGCKLDDLAMRLHPRRPRAAHRVLAAGMRLRDAAGPRADAIHEARTEGTR